MELDEISEKIKSEFKMRGKDFTQESYENIRIIKNLKDYVATCVSKIFRYNVKPDLVLGIAPFHRVYITKSFLSSPLWCLEAMSYVYPSSTGDVEAVCLNPLAITWYIENKGLADKKNQILTNLLAEEFSHIAIDKKFKLTDKIFELHTKKTFEGKPVPPQDIDRYIYILLGKGEACAKHVAKKLSGMEILTSEEMSGLSSPDQISGEGKLSSPEEMPDIFPYLSYRLVTNFLEELERDFRKFLREMGKVRKKDIDSFNSLLQNLK